MIALLLALAHATPTGTPTGSATGTPTGTATGMPTDTGAVSPVTLFSPLGPEIDPGEALFVEVDGLACEDFEVRNEGLVLQDQLCEDVGPTEAGRVLVFKPTTAWDGLVVRLYLAGLDDELVGFAIASDPVDVDVEAVAVNRTVSFDGLSQRVCREGPIAGVAMGPSEPTEAERILGPWEEIVYHGSTDGSWPEAAPEAQATFWFVAWDRAGERKAWVADPVTLASDGMVRTDLRLGFSAAEPTVCPSADSPWTLGDEVKAQGAVPPQTPPDEDEPAGCGCQTGPAPTGWLWLGLLGLARRRYQPPWKPNSAST